MCLEWQTVCIDNAISPARPCLLHPILVVAYVSSATIIKMFLVNVRLSAIIAIFAHCKQHHGAGASNKCVVAESLIVSTEFLDMEA